MSSLCALSVSFLRAAPESLFAGVVFAGVVFAEGIHVIFALPMN